jgi:septum formation protein
MSDTRLILASASPRRKALLSAAGFPFEAMESGVDERVVPGESGAHYVMRMARAKALTVAKLIPRALVLGADTIVLCDDEIMLKPHDEYEARRMLARLSGRTHEVITAYAVASGDTVLEAEAIVSHVTFRPLGDQEIAQYIATGEPFDKAGAYGIQGKGADFIAQVTGSRENVMGLPVGEVAAALGRCGLLPKA